MKNKKILFICAHPDDEVLGCGGVIAKYIKQKNNIRIIFLSEGITARYDDHDIKSKKALKEIEIRNNNALKALKILGVKKNNIIFYNNLCCRLDTLPIISITKIIEKNLQEFNPEVVFTHNNTDVNVDHQICFKATLAACRPTKNQSVNQLYTFEVLSSTEWNTLNDFKPQVFEDITDFIDLKIKATKMYKNEIFLSPHSRSIEKIKALASFRGAYVGFKYAEAFQLIRMNLR